MTDNICIGGVRLSDTQDSICMGGVPVQKVCIGGVVVWERESCEPGWDGDTVSRVADIRLSGAGTSGPGNDTDARIYLGDIQAVFSSVPGGLFSSLIAGISSGGADTAVSGGSVSEVDPSAGAQTPIVATAANCPSDIIEMRVSQLSGDTPTLANYGPAAQVVSGIAPLYTLGQWVPYGIGLAISVANTQVAAGDSGPGNPIIGTFEYQFRYSDASVITGVVQLSADAAPVGGPPPP